MGIVLWIIFGALAGWLASIVVGKDSQQGALGNIIVGIIGALLGGMIMSALGFSGITGFDLWSLIIAVGGAVLLLYIVSLFTGSRYHHSQG